MFTGKKGEETETKIKLDNRIYNKLNTKSILDIIVQYHLKW